MGLLDNNKINTVPFTGLEGTNFIPLASNENYDTYLWKSDGARKNLKLTFRDIYAWADDRVLYLVKGKITDEPTVIEVNQTNFPGLRPNTGTSTLPYIVRVIACPCKFATPSQPYGGFSSLYNNNCRVCVIFSNGQIYHNYPSCNNTYDFYDDTYTTSARTILVESLFTKFVESVVWDIAGRKNPSNDADFVAANPDAYYYNPALESKCYEMHPAISQANGYGNTVGFPATNNVNPASDGIDIGTRARFFRTDMDDFRANSFDYMGGYISSDLYTMIGTYQANSGEHPCRICIFGTQDGGRNWYNMYEFGSQNLVKYDNTIKKSSTSGIPLVQTGSEGSGIYKIKRRTNIVPSAANKEISNIFEYDNEVNISSISGDDSGITFTAPSHGLSNYDIIVVDYQENVVANNRAFDWMVNSSANATTGGNGILFVVTNVDTDTFKVTLFIWNADADLPARHIHAMNRCKDGVSICTGEDYPSGGWILYNSIIAADTFAGYNVARKTDKYNNFIRLTSTSISVSRGLGCILEQEDKDTYCYIAVDTDNIEMNNITLPEGRTSTFKHGSTGVWKIPISGMDSLKDNGLMKLNTPETAYGLQEMNNAFVYIGQLGQFAISYDKGQTWCESKLPVSGMRRFSGMTYDRKFSIENLLVQLKK
jgi:hypothetical protein